MNRTTKFALIAAFALGQPVMAMAQATSEGNIPPTAGDAAAQVGRNPPSATSESGQRVEPSDKLWNNPRTVHEQPGTQPPANSDPQGRSHLDKQSHHVRKHGAHHAHESSDHETTEEE
ncbi:hypothetical protein [Acetobacter estunensis]|uniref:hypothetical protein n=1 Tax=Acetobacter estunensis TaxID=104097 RepID=UPI001C2DD53C|nr:hypothetical protein [Acetobacter estunensis]MBV1836151.1 hypothetical protein [Acetobacter estunensis]